jgi:hypothetical protein
MANGASSAASGQQKTRPIEGRVFPLRQASAVDGVPREFVARLVVMLGVQLARLVGVVLRMEVVGARDVRVVGGLLGEAGLVRLGSGVVVTRGVLVMRGSILVVLDLFFGGTCCFFVEVNRLPRLRGRSG